MKVQRRTTIQKLNNRRYSTSISDAARICLPMRQKETPRQDEKPKSETMLQLRQTRAHENPQQLPICRKPTGSNRKHLMTSRGTMPQKRAAAWTKDRENTKETVSAYETKRVSDYKQTVCKLNGFCLLLQTTYNICMKAAMSVSATNVRHFPGTPKKYAISRKSSAS